MVMGELEQTSQLLVLGGGPAGYSAAFRAADLGVEVTLVDPLPRLGGVCLHSGCVPAKSLLFLTQVMRDAKRIRSMGITYQSPHIDLESVRRWVDSVIDDQADELTQQSRRRDIQLITARAQFDTPRSVRLQGSEIHRIRFEKAIIATGARPTLLPGSSFQPAGRIMDPARALAMADIPQTVLVIGGNYMGLELGTIFATLGSRVTLVEKGDSLLQGVDEDLVAILKQRLENLFESIYLQTRVTSLQETNQGVAVRMEGAETRQMDFARIVAATGARPAIEDLGLEHTGVNTDPNGFLKVDERQRTSNPAIFAAGDVTGWPLLAHKAARQGKVAAESAAGQASAFDVQAVPIVVYTDPPIAWCGITEESARRQGRHVTVVRQSWRHSARAATLAAGEGLTKIFIEPSNGRIIGAGIVGRQAEALIAEAVIAIEMGALAEDVALCMHPIPTLSEITAEAAESHPAGQPPSSGQS
jgi:dihydrolipoamide dehydrogenase